MFDFHSWFAWFAVVANGLVAVWALASIRFPKLRQPSLWYCIAIAQVALVVEAATGIYLYAAEGIEVETFHVFYGSVAVIGVALGYIYLKGSDWVSQKRELFYGVLSLFLMGIGIRALLLTSAV